MFSYVAEQSRNAAEDQHAGAFHIYTVERERDCSSCCEYVHGAVHALLYATALPITLYIMKLAALARSRPSSRTTAASSAAGPLGASRPAATAAAADSASISISAIALRARRDGVFPLPG